jgi:hydrogenase maturation protease
MGTPGERREALVIGIGNLLWADEGFGIRAVEALHAAYAFPPGVALLDGGTLGLALYDEVAMSRRVLVLDAVDYGLAPGAIKILRDDEVPAWGRTKLSPHQMGFNDVLGLAALQGRSPDAVTVIGVQPEVLDDFGGSLRECVRAQLSEAVKLAAGELAAWGLAGRRRRAGEGCEPLNAQPLALTAYESGRPSEREACRVGDARLLSQAVAAGEKEEPCA